MRTVYLILVSEKYQANNYKRMEISLKRSIIRFWNIPNYEARLYVLRGFRNNVTQARKKLIYYGIIPIDLTMHKLKKSEEEYTLEDYYTTKIFYKNKSKLENYKINKLDINNLIIR